MRIFKKAVLILMVVGVLTSCFCISAGATKRHWAFKTDGYYDSGQTYFDASPGNRIRFVATPKCNLSNATATYTLYNCYWNGAYLMPRSQNLGVGKQIRGWWRDANAGNYSLTIQPYNNQYANSTLRASIDYPSAWLENFWGDLWT